MTILEVVAGGLLLLGGGALVALFRGIASGRG